MGYVRTDHAAYRQSARPKLQKSFPFDTHTHQVFPHFNPINGPAMAPLTAAQTLLSPAELSYLHSSLSLDPPIRPDSRAPTQFRPLVAETDILPSANGSARICFADGTEAIVGVKAEVEKSTPRAGDDGRQYGAHFGTRAGQNDEEMGDAEGEGEGNGEGGRAARKGVGQDSWVEMTISIPGFRDDDALPVFLAAMLNEALLATGDLPDRLWINRRFHWRLYIDVSFDSIPPPVLVSQSQAPPRTRIYRSVSPSVHPKI